MTEVEALLLLFDKALAVGIFAHLLQDMTVRHNTAVIPELQMTWQPWVLTFGVALIVGAL